MDRITILASSGKERINIGEMDCPDHEAIEARLFG
jgi:hypothetical protein